MALWLKWVLLAVAGIVVVLALAMMLAGRLWNRDSAKAFAALDERLLPLTTKRVDFKELESLPEPVAKYLRSALKDGQPMIRAATATWGGEFRIGENWAPIRATQHFTTQPPGFVWDASIQSMPLVPTLVRDHYAAGHGGIHATIAGLITVADDNSGSALAQAALERYLAESIWLPTALLPAAGVRWTAIDATHARATVTDSGIEASVIFEFDINGNLLACHLPQRYRDSVDGQPRRAPWEARVMRFETHDGMQVPGSGVAQWHYPEGLHPYWRGKLVSVQYDFVQ